MSNRKKQIRAAFRDCVFTRDRYTCRVCGRKFAAKNADEYLDAHHITDRHNMPNGGYVKANGISLCKNGSPSCHELAEKQEDGLTPAELYRRIGSSYELALKESENVR